MAAALLTRLKRYLPLVILTTILAAAGAYVVARASVTYRATATFRLTDFAATGPGSTTANRVDPDVTVETEAPVFRSSAIVQRIAREIGATPDGVLGALAVQTNSDSGLVTVVAETGDRADSVRIANAVEPAYNALRREQRQQRIDQVSRSLSQQADGLLGRSNTVRRQLQGTSDASRRATLRSRQQAILDRYQEAFGQRQDLLAQAASQPSAATVITPATRDRTVPSSTRRVALLAAVLGLLAGLALALILEQFRAIVRTSQDVAGATGTTCLSGVPRVPRRARRRSMMPVLHEPAGTLAESLRILGVNLLRLADEHARVVVVTSSRAGEGKTFVAMNLAAVLARGGRRTALVSADLRRPAADAAVPADGERETLSSLLLRGDEAGELTHDDVRDAFVTFPASALEILPAGEPTANATDLLTSGPLGTILGHARDSFDVVVIDAPPLAGLGDALVLAGHADAVLLVASVNHTTQRSLTWAADALRAGAHGQLFTVANRTTGRTEAGAYHEPRSLAAPDVTTTDSLTTR